jgi:hypothetical protein
MTFSYVKVNDQIYFKKFYHLPLSNPVFTLSYTWSYSLFSEPETSESIGRVHVHSLDGMASTNSTIQVLFSNCYDIHIVIQFFRSLKSSIIQVVLFQFTGLKNRGLIMS